MLSIVGRFMLSRSLKRSLVVLAAGAVALVGVGAPATCSPSETLFDHIELFAVLPERNSVTPSITPA